MRRLSLVESAIAASLLGSLLAIAIPTFAREVESSRMVEAVDGLERMSASALAYAEGHGGALPESAPLTPATPPRGTREVDPEGTWEHPTWRALAFRAAAEGKPHAFSFAFERTESGFTGQARGDLDGDGIQSLFEVRGVKPAGGPLARVPGMYVERELE